jgi:hypothetical protein
MRGLSRQGNSAGVTILFINEALISYSNVISSLCLAVMLSIRKKTIYRDKRPYFTWRLEINIDTEKLKNEAIERIRI